MKYLFIYLCLLQFLYQCFIVFSVEVFHCLKFVPRYFILFDAVANGIVFLISLSDNLLLVYRNSKDFCMLILLFFNKTFLILEKGRESASRGEGQREREITLLSRLMLSMEPHVGLDPMILGS